MARQGIEFLILVVGLIAFIGVVLGVTDVNSDSVVTEDVTSPTGELLIGSTANFTSNVLTGVNNMVFSSKAYLVQESDGEDMVFQLDNSTGSTNNFLTFDNSAFSAVFSVPVDMVSNRIINLADPTEAQDAATKSYVDNNANTGVPSGTIVMWSGSISSIPDGWVLCNGSNGTPDLRNRFIVGAGDQYSVNGTGGTKSVTLSESQIPSHTHGGSTGSAGSHSHSTASSSPVYGTGTDVTDSFSDYWGLTSMNDYVQSPASTDSAGSHSHSINDNPAGGDGSHENRPPYFSLAFIMKK